MNLPDRKQANLALRRIQRRKNLRRYAAERKAIILKLKKLPIAKLREIASQHDCL